MSFWVEVRCDVFESGCYSHNNDGPKQSVDTRTRLPGRVRVLEQQAIKEGWARTRTGIACPSCKKLLLNRTGGSDATDRK